MIVYRKTKQAFLDDVNNDNIADIIRAKVLERLNRKVGTSEYTSWQNSLQYMSNVLSTGEIPADSGVAIEYNIPRTSNRIDFIVSGQNNLGKECVILIELKQWTEIQLTDKDAIVVTRFSGGMVEATHPSYQAWSYANLLQGFNETVYSENIELKPCAYLHNFNDNNCVVANDFYSHYIEKAPVFFKDDKVKLRNYISELITKGDFGNVIERIENGKIRPCKSLADSMSSMIKGNQEFVMIDAQKIIYENALSLSKKSSRESKNVLIVNGGPGTGKSVIAVNLLVALTKLGLLAQYVTKNSAPRSVYQSKLTGTLKKTEIANFFVGSGSFINISEANKFDALIIDEAHRLNAKSGMFQNLGENQIKEIISASNFSVFFLDEDQRVTLSDIGSEQEIEKWARFHNAQIHKLELTSQFRCGGSDGYLAWLDNVLEIRDTANNTLDKLDYDFQIFDDPNKLKDAIFEKNKESNKARLVAGYCWSWASKKDPKAMDITLPEHNFAMQWNLGSDGMLWIMQPESVNQIGCIHTCQGLEVDYIGVIVGPDLIYRDGKIITDASKRSKQDKSIFGYKKKLKENQIGTEKLLDSLIKNTYRTLMSRGMKGCYLYFTDKETEAYFRDNIA